MEINAELQPNASIKPVLNVQDIKNLMHSMYGFKVFRVTELNGYDDRNFHVVAETVYIGNNCYSEFVLKIVNSLESKKPQLFDAQTALLLRLNDTGIVCPKPIPMKNKLYFAKITLTSGDHIIRLFEYIMGTILYSIPPSSGLLREIGQYVAKLDMSMKTFCHDAYENHKPSWTLAAVPTLRQLLFAIKDEEKRELVLTVITEFEKKVLSVANTLERGLIHGDINEQNIIVEKIDNDWQIKAIIDFGDCHVTCYLFEFAITMTYMMLQARDINAGGFVLAGYSSVRDLPEQEYLLLKICIAARLCQSLVIGAYSYLQDPNNSYVLATAEHGWKLLDVIWKESESDLLTRWKKIAETV